MKIIEHIRFYDMDDTLFFTPKPDEDVNGNKIIRIGVNPKSGEDKEYLTSLEYYNSTGEPWPFGGWWGRRESLDMNVFDIKRNEYVYNEYLKDKKGVDKLMVMMTGRIKPLENQVKSILDKHNMLFDRYYFNPGGGMKTVDYKIGVFQKCIDEMKDLKSLKMYDDRDEHISDFLSWSEKTMNETGVEVEVIHIKGESRVN